MSRLNSTLSEDTRSMLARGARSKRVPVATYTRKLIESELERDARKTFIKKLVSDCAADREDVSELLSEMEGGQADLPTHE
jgi:hypothetical protein